jgi:hypothetical protein
MAIRYFAIAAGVVYALVGLLGFIPGINVEGPPNAPPLTVSNFYGHLLGLFPVNLLHNLVHLAIGAWGIFAYSRGIPGSRMFARGLAVLYALFAVMGFIPGLNTVFGLIPLYGHDVWLHAVTAVVAAYFGWFHRVDVGDHVRDRTGGVVGGR